MIACLMINLVISILHDWFFLFLVINSKVENVWLSIILKVIIFLDGEY